MCNLSLHRQEGIQEHTDSWWSGLMLRAWCQEQGADILILFSIPSSHRTSILLSFNLNQLCFNHSTTASKLLLRFVGIMSSHLKTDIDLYIICKPPGEMDIVHIAVTKQHFRPGLQDWKLSNDVVVEFWGSTVYCAPVTWKQRVIFLIILLNRKLYEQQRKHKKTLYSCGAGF